MTEKMPWKYRIAIIVIILSSSLLGFLVGVGAYTLITGHSLPVEAISPANPIPVPSFTDIQQMLVDRGHNIKVDGKICKGWNCPEHSETLTAWGKEICNQYNREICSRMQGGNK